MFSEETLKEKKMKRLLFSPQKKPSAANRQNVHRKHDWTRDDGWVPDPFLSTYKGVRSGEKIKLLPRVLPFQHFFQCFLNLGL